MHSVQLHDDHSILNEMFNSKDTFSSMIRFSLEDPNKPRIHPGLLNTPFFFQNTFLGAELSPELEAQSARCVQEKKKKKEPVTCSAYETREDKAKASPRLVPPWACNL